MTASDMHQPVLDVRQTFVFFFLFPFLKKKNFFYVSCSQADVWLRGPVVQRALLRAIIFWTDPTACCPRAQTSCRPAAGGRKESLKLH